ncbi:MAG: type I restriction enzyme HsdR N-terminal domain-containing protein [Bacteroidales bacterium]|nr:type I restriction enzyme HsdR N-terminal domain-containing protein [Bacteroidales bacterium]
MISLNLPPFEIKIAERKGQKVVFDILRRRYVALKPEEWVRQHFINYLLNYKGYPAALLANEVTIEMGGVARRCDSVLYHQDGGRPRIIMEYKGPHVTITQAVFNQAAAYNSVLRADYLIVTNGLTHYCCMMDYANNSAAYLQDIPDFQELK